MRACSLCPTGLPISLDSCPTPRRRHPPPRVLFSPSPVKSGSLLSQSGSVMKFDRKLLTGGCDNHLRLWRLNEETGGWYDSNAFSSESETAHSDWVRDAAFAPSLGLPSNTIASCSEDKTVSIWSEDAATGAWRRAKVLQFDTKVYKVSWSLMGNILAVAQGDNKVSLWKESLDGDWKNLSQAQAQQITAAAPAPAFAAQTANNDYQQQHQQQPPPQITSPQQQQYAHQQQQYQQQQPIAYNGAAY